MAKLKESVTFRSGRQNFRIEVRGAPSERTNMSAMLHPDVKMVEFRDGIFATDDPEIVEFLDARPDCWRADDPFSDLRARFGPEEFERIKKQFLAAETLEEVK